MKLRTIRYMLREGTLNIYKNKLMTFASTGTVIASLIIFGIFLMITINLVYNAAVIKDQPEIIVYCDYQLQELSVNNIEDKIKNHSLYMSHEKISKQQVFQELKEVLGDDLIEGYTDDFLMDYFKVQLNDSANSEQFKNDIEKVEGVDEVRFPQNAINVITRIIYWINIGSVVVLIILLLISISIISNTIKLTVYARRKEISIMKYIGATDWFIRWPFIIEGMIIGFIGAIISFVLTSYAYNAAAEKINEETINIGISIVSIVELNQIGLQILIIYTIIGVIMGAIGSIVALRKYLEV